MSKKTTKIIAIALIGVILNVSSISCETTEQYKIAFSKNVYSILSQIPSDYNIVKQTDLGSKTNKEAPGIIQDKKSDRFVQKQTPDYYALKSLDAEHQTKKYKEIQGKNIFTPSYIQSQTNKITQQKNDFQSIVKDEKNKETSQGTSKIQQVIQKPQVPFKIIEKKINQEIINQKSAQIYNEFKNIEVLKQKNLRQAIKNSQQNEVPTQNFQKLIGYIIVGLILSFAIIKKATKSQPSIPHRNQERTELRLRDTVEDDQSVSSSDSDEQK